MSIKFYLNEEVITVCTIPGSSYIKLYNQKNECLGTFIPNTASLFGPHPSGEWLISTSDSLNKKNFNKLLQIEKDVIHFAQERLKNMNRANRKAITSTF